jgi:SAM-dependent methyltransferase
MAFPKQMRRLLGLPDADPTSPGTDEPEMATDVGLRDAALSSWFNEAKGELFRGVPIAVDDIVVDVGCGEGGWLSFCARQGAHVIGIDHDAAAIERARDRIEPTAARCKEFHVLAAEQLPVADGFATRVICTEVLEHVDDPAVVLRELVRIGKPGALYLITVPDPVAEGVQQKVAPPLYFRQPNHVRILPRDEFRGLVEDAGLEIVEVGRYGFYWALWWAMFWACDVDLASPIHPALDNWARAWSALLDTADGPRVKEALDDVMPKSQVIVARKPAESIL